MPKPYQNHTETIPAGRGLHSECKAISFEELGGWRVQVNLEKPEDFAVGLLLTEGEAQTLRDQLTQALLAMAAVTAQEGDGTI